VNQVDFLKTVVNILEGHGVSYMIVGSFVSSRFGEARFTNGVDIVIDVDESQVLNLCEAFPSDSFYVSRQAALEAVRTRRQFNVIHPSSGNKVDFMIARRDPWSRSELSRRTRKSIVPDCLAYTASAEDVILAKMAFYKEGASDKHLRDITGMLQVSGGEIDQAYIRGWAVQLDLDEIWQMILAKLSDQKS
jgi:hypothetical protein